MPFSISSMPEPLHNKRLFIGCEVKIKSELNHSMSNQCNEVRNQIGYIIQILGDGFCLIEFPQYIVKRKFKMEIMEWYIHELDLYLTK